MFSIESLIDPGFSWQTSLSLAAASKLSYEQHSVVENVITNRWGFSTLDYFDVEDTQCFVAQTSSHALVAFRGTESLGDWLGNMKVFPTEQPYGTVHKGFFQAYSVVHRKILATLSQDGAITKNVWLTGHSLGGALATIAAAELIDRANILGIYTYGQPRLGNKKFGEFINKAYGENFFRFVNDDDLVTRVPPGFRHAGTLIHFDEDGNVRQAADEAEVAVIESEALIESEFQEMQKEIRNLQTAISKHYGGVGNEEVEQDLEASIEGILPSVSDHSLDRYIAHIRRFIATDEIGLDVEQDQQLLKSIETLKAAGSPAAVPTISDESPALLRINNPNWKAPANLKIHSKFGTFVTVQATLENLETLRKDPNVVSIEASRNAGFEELASSLSFIGADQIHRPPLTERGDSALIGIIDTGIDVLHEAFLDGNGNSRIFAIWNQRDSSGLSPNAINSTKFSQDYGTLYTASDIGSFLNGTKAIPSALRDPAHHGTHVASIAAGRAVGKLNDGLAPDAKIVVVIPNMKSSPGDPPSLGYSVSHVDALYFLKMVSSGGNAVSSMALPMVVNVSLGMNAGAHDGTSTLEAAFDSVTRGGRDPGFVIVKSAGNERGHGGHARIRAAIASTPIEWTSTTGVRFQDYFEVWYDALDELEFRLVDPAGNSSTKVDAANLIAKDNLGGNACQLRLTTLHRDNGDNCLVIKILPQTRYIQEGTWRLNVVGTNLGSGQGYVDIWVERDSSRAVSFVIEEPKTTLSIPGTADTVISVGASNSALPLALTSSSSYGRTRDNRPKPDIVAPGTNIRAAFSNQIGADGNSDHQATTTYTGTSMAAPHVAGALALVLSKRHKQSGKPQYNAQQLRKALRKYAKNSAGFHNEGYGWGVLNAAELFTKLT